MTHPVEIRIAGPADAEKITGVINSAFRPAEEFFVDGDRIDVREVLDLLRSGQFFVADCKGAVIGCVYFQPLSPRAYLGLLSVDPSHQRSGLGSQLMSATENPCLGLGCHFIDIKVVNLRKELPDFYQKRGYVEAGTSPFPAEVETKQPCYFINMTKPL